ncbi:hypothetical protein HK097_005168, partial [Rhizophlyctis rosea]
MGYGLDGGCGSDGLWGLGVVWGVVANETSPTVQLITKWLITTACDRGVKLNDGDTELPRVVKGGKEDKSKVRMFAIRVLGGLPSRHSQITTCLLSLFDDPDFIIRSAVAHTIAVRSLNLCHDFGEGKPTVRLDHGFGCHKEDGKCEADGNHFGIGGWGRNPFSILVGWVDALGRGDRQNSMEWRNSHRQRETFSLWARYLTHHILHVCPLLSSSFPHHLLHRVATELQNRLTTTSPHSALSSACKHCIAFVVGGILEGSYNNENGVGRPPYCDAKVLRSFAGCLWTVRRDGGVGVRCVGLEVLGRLIGYRKGDEGVDGDGDSDLDYENLAIVYRLVRGEAPFQPASHGSGTVLAGAIDDEVERRSEVEGLKKEILRFGARRHLVALYLKVGGDGGVGVDVDGEKVGGEFGAIIGMGADEGGRMDEWGLGEASRHYGGEEGAEGLGDEVLRGTSRFLDEAFAEVGVGADFENGGVGNVDNDGMKRVGRESWRPLLTGFKQSGFGGDVSRVDDPTPGIEVAATDR